MAQKPRKKRPRTRRLSPDAFKLDGYIPAVEAARRLGVSGGRLYRLIADNRLVSKRIGDGNGSLWVREDSIEAYHQHRLEWLRIHNGCGRPLPV